MIVTILILIDGFLQLFKIVIYKQEVTVTILILIDGFLQSGVIYFMLTVSMLSQSLF